MFVTTFSCYFLQTSRPDIFVHAVQENAGSMLGRFCRVIVKASNITEACSHKIRTKWATLTRTRWWLSTMGCDDACPHPRARPGPLEAGWVFRGKVHAPRPCGHVAPIQGPSVQLSTNIDGICWCMRLPNGDTFRTRISCVRENKSSP